jgi:hypothetical protein
MSSDTLRADLGTEQVDRRKLARHQAQTLTAPGAHRGGSGTYLCLSAALCSIIIRLWPKQTRGKLGEWCTALRGGVCGGVVKRIKDPTSHCLYCGRPWTPGIVRKSKEHPLGQWRKKIETDLPAKQTIHEARVVFDDVANELIETPPETRTRNASLLTLHTREVCKDCNMGWMNRL